MSSSPVEDVATVQSEEFTRKAVEAIVRCTDKDDNGLELFCYDNTNGEHMSGLKRECRGVIFHENTVIMKAFPHTFHISEDNTEQIQKDIVPVFDQCEFYDSYEGALVRMFYFADKWYICTHRKLDAFKSKWACNQSFGELFVDALSAEFEESDEFKRRLGDGDEPILDKFKATLCKDKQYMFLVLNNENNRIVCIPPSRACVYHVGTFIDGKLTMTEDVGLRYPVKHEFKTPKDLEEHMATVTPEYVQGVIVFAPDNQQYKIMNSTYHRLFNVRGNVSSIPFRYLEVRMNSSLVNDLYSLYPTYAKKFEEYENSLYDISHELFKAYWSRFVTKQNRTKYPSEEFRVLQQCHTWHVKDRKHNLVSQEVVIDVMNRQRPSALNAMLKRHFKTKQSSETVKTVVKNRIRSNTVRTCCAKESTDPASPLMLSVPVVNVEMENERVLSDENS